MDLTKVEQLNKRLEELSKLQLNVGVPSSGNTSVGDDLNMASLAAIHEFGATIKVKARSQTVYRQVDSNGDFKNNGRFSKKASANFSSSHKVAAHTITIPERSFLRSTIIEHNGYSSEFASATKKVAKGSIDPKAVLEALGMTVVGDVKQKMYSGDFAPLSDATIKRKGSSKPLNDTGALIQSMNFEVK